MTQMRRLKDLTDFQRGTIVGARLAGLSIHKTADLLKIAKSTISKVMTDYTQQGKTSSGKVNSGRKTRFDGEVRGKLEKVLMENPDASRKELMTELNKLISKPVAIKTFDRWVRIDKSLRKVHLKNIKEQIKRKNVGRGRKPMIKYTEDPDTSIPSDLDKSKEIEVSLPLSHNKTDSSELIGKVSESNVNTSNCKIVSAESEVLEHPSTSKSDGQSLVLNSSDSSSHLSSNLSTQSSLQPISNELIKSQVQPLQSNSNIHSGDSVSHTSNTTYRTPIESSAPNLPSTMSTSIVTNYHHPNIQQTTSNANNLTISSGLNNPSRRESNSMIQHMSLDNSTHLGSNNHLHSLIGSHYTPNTKQQCMVPNSESIITNPQMMSKYLQSLNPIHNPTALIHNQNPEQGMVPQHNHHLQHPMYQYTRWF